MNILKSKNGVFLGSHLSNCFDPAAMAQAFLLLGLGPSLDSASCLGPLSLPLASPSSSWPWLSVEWSYCAASALAPFCLSGPASMPLKALSLMVRCWGRKA